MTRPADAERGVLGALAAAVERRVPVALATVVATRRSVPRRPGAKMLVYADGRQVGTVGGGEMEARVRHEAAAALGDGRPRLLEYDLVDAGRGDPGVCGGNVSIYLEPYMPSPTVVVIGCGHVGRAVVELAHWLGYETVAIDDRPELVSAEALPDADVRLAGPIGEVLGRVDIDEDTSVVLVTRSTEVDAIAIPLLLETPARYIGVMGSKRRWLVAREGLAGSGVTAEDLDRIHSPIGAELHAETLEEIAVSILAEVIAMNRTPNTGDDGGSD